MRSSARAVRPASPAASEPTWRGVSRALVSGSSQVTDYLRLGTLLMPDNSGSEMTSEAVHAGLSLMTLLSDFDEAERGGAVARYRIEKRGGTAASGKSESLLQGMRCVELFLEMAADRTVGVTRKVPFLLALEFAKALCQISLSMRGRDLPTRGKRLGLQRTQSLLCQRQRQLSTAGQRFWTAGSVLHALRPLVYLAAMHRFGGKSWAPWFLSLLVDLAADVAASRPLFHAKMRAAVAMGPAAQAAAAGASRSVDSAAARAPPPSPYPPAAQEMMPQEEVGPGREVIQAGEAAKVQEEGAAPLSRDGQMISSGHVARSDDNQQETSDEAGKETGRVGTEMTLGVTKQAMGKSGVGAGGSFTDVEMAMRVEIQRRRGLLLFYLLR